MENGQLFPEHGAESILFATVLNSGHLSGIIFCMFMSYFVKRNKKKNPNIYQIWLPIIYFHCILFKLFSSYVYVYTGIYHIVNFRFDKNQSIFIQRVFVMVVTHSLPPILDPCISSPAESTHQSNSDIYLGQHRILGH